MEVVGKDPHRQWFDTEISCLNSQLIFNPNLAMVEILSRDGIELKKEATACHKPNDM